MATSGQLQSKVDRFKKKLAEKGASLAADKKRILTKKLRRFQRARRTALALEKRADAQRAEGGKGAVKAPGEKPNGDKPVREKPIGDKPPGEEGEPTGEKLAGAPVSGAQKEEAGA